FVASWRAPSAAIAVLATESAREATSAIVKRRRDWSHAAAADTLNHDGLAHAAFVAEDLQIAADLVRVSGGLFRIVRKLDGRSAIGLAHLAHQRNGLEALDLARRAILEIVGEIGAPAERHTHAALEVEIGAFDRLHIQRVGEDQKLLARVLSVLLPPGDDALAALDRGCAVGAEAGPFGHPMGSGAQERLGSERVRQDDEQVAAIITLPVLQHLIGRSL